MNLVDSLGLAAGSLTTIAFVPQVLKIWVSKSAEDVSVLMFAVFSLGVVLWLAYGIALGAWPVIIANVVTLALSILVVVLKFRYRDRDRDRGDDAE